MTCDDRPDSSRVYEMKGNLCRLGDALTKMIAIVPAALDGHLQIDSRHTPKWSVKAEEFQDPS